MFEHIPKFVTLTRDRGEGPIEIAVNHIRSMYMYGAATRVIVGDDPKSNFFDVKEGPTTIKERIAKACTLP